MLALILSALLLVIGCGIAIYSAVGQTLTGQHLAILAACLFLLAIVLVLSAIERHLNAIQKSINAHKETAERTERHIIELVRRTPVPVMPATPAEQSPKADQADKSDKPPTLEDW